MKKKVGRPKQKKSNYQMMLIRMDTNDMILDWQAEIKEKLGFKLSKIDIIHIGVEQLVKNGFPKY